MKFALGQLVPSTEDPRRLTGRAGYTERFRLAASRAWLRAARSCPHPLGGYTTRVLRYVVFNDVAP